MSGYPTVLRLLVPRCDPAYHDQEVLEEFDTVMQKLYFLSGNMYYIATALGIFITPFPAILLLWIFPGCVK